MFALGIAQGLTQVNAARAAGYKNPENNASAIMVRNGVSDAIEQHRERLEAAGRVQPQLTPEFIMRRTAEIATQNENVGAAVAALRLGADIAGMLQGGNRDLPDAAKQLMEALGKGLSSGKSERQKPEAIEVHEVPARGKLTD